MQTYIIITREISDESESIRCFNNHIYIIMILLSILSGTRLWYEINLKNGISQDSWINSGIFIVGMAEFMLSIPIHYKLFVEGVYGNVKFYIIGNNWSMIILFSHFAHIYSVIINSIIEELMNCCKKAQKERTKFN